MCGVLAIYRQRGISERDEKAARSLLSHLVNRGPDNCHLVRVNDHMLLGHARLRVASLTPEADQPKSLRRQNLHISFNGEIFNLVDLKNKLGGKGVAGCCEAEVLLLLYEKYGQNCFSMLEGQFAIILYDGIQDRLLLARDPFGICPLYYMAPGADYYVASSVRGLITALPEARFTPDPEAIEQYLLLRYALAPRTIVKEIRQVCPGEIVVLEKHHVTHKRYGGLEGLGFSEYRREEDVFPQLTAEIEQSINLNCQAASDVGLFLSGGLDSSIILSVASKRRSHMPLLSLDMGAAEELTAAQLVAEHFHCNVTPVPLSENERMFEHLMAAMDHPTGARDALATFTLARALQEKFPSAKAVLTGAGADELFSGYRSSYFAPLKKKDMRSSLENMLMNYATIHKSRPVGVMQLAACPLNLDRVTDDIYQIMKATCPGVDELSADALQNLFYMTTHLPGWELAINDMMCMFFGREPRVPFLTKTLTRLAFGLPDDLRYCEGTEKYILRRGFGQILPPEITHRRKLPLSRPVAQWMVKSGFTSQFRKVSFRDRGIFNLEWIRQLDDQEDFDVLWRVVILEKWLQLCLD